MGIGESALQNSIASCRLPKLCCFHGHVRGQVVRLAQRIPSLNIKMASAAMHDAISHPCTNDFSAGAVAACMLARLLSNQLATTMIM